MGPNTTIVLDELVFDPSGSNGRVVLSVAVGVTRFVSGILPKSDYEIRTPTAVIGVRGTSFDLYVKPNGDSTVVLGSGELTMRERERSLAQAVRLQAGTRGQRRERRAADGTRAGSARRRPGAVAASGRAARRRRCGAAPAEYRYAVAGAYSHRRL
jgi:hypothetical protein